MTRDEKRAYVIGTVGMDYAKEAGLLEPERLDGMEIRNETGKEVAVKVEEARRPSREEVLEGLRKPFVDAPEIEAAIAYLETAGQPERFWGYGIVDRSDTAWFSEGCVSPTTLDLALEVEQLNAAEFDDQRPYRICRLLVER